MIKFKNYYIRPKMDDSDYNNYFTERYNHNLTMQARINDIQTVYSENDLRHQNPIVRVEMVDIRNASDGEFIRDLLVDYPEPAKRKLYFDGEIKEGDYLQLTAKLTVLEKTAAAEYDAPKFVKFNLPKIMPFIRGNGTLEKIEHDKVKPIIKGVLSHDKD